MNDTSIATSGEVFKEVEENFSTKSTLVRTAKSGNHSRRSEKGETCNTIRF
ncbi:hypothetical protein KIN20_000132 [Parelaphostrongylus tenuis]|uniref:Uncharacterized protein n=1 Tax=Parelaphostrongylus tenuis TaxID=148309 RepID=A0AAD5QBM4_PARTN|nr:hypothetical protein KIN20_000132 [Parelaphostrongylus tenuis]